MRAVNTYCTVVALLALVMVAGHYTAIAIYNRISQTRLPPPIDDPFRCLPPPAKDSNIIKLLNHDQWVAAARKAAHDIAAEKGEVTVDDVHEACPPPAGMDGRLMMAAFPRSEWEVAGYVQSKRHDVNHGRRIARWVRKGAA